MRRRSLPADTRPYRTLHASASAPEALGGSGYGTVCCRYGI